ncbi:MAG: tripartite tricarboxylate transporter TctB family protein [Proteobacteria bacterium]|nr:tripartite tricarboxylate transporter TctB family protein [Pseudomonadota bacterium]
MQTDRITGAALIILGGLLIWWIIPWQAEAVGYGWLRPRTLPYIIAVGLLLCGAWMMLRPVAEALPAANWPRAALYAGILVAGLALMSRFGFLWVGPPMALVLMLIAGERRPLWLTAGAAGTPAAIWVYVAVLLERPLP